MNLKVTLLFVLFSMSLSGDVISAKLSAHEIVEHTDQIRNPSGAFRFDAQITEFRSGIARDTMWVAIHSKPDESGGQFRSLVEIHQPVRDRGKLVLRNGNSLWFYDPFAKNSVRISPQQRLLGQASNGDVMTTNFAKDYQSKLIAKEKVKSADKIVHDCFRLEMIATNSEVSYPRIEYWVDSDSFRPIKGRFYAESGRLLKTAYYRQFKSILGEHRPTEVIIIDGVDRKKVTRMKFSQYAYENIPELWFQRDYLPRVDP